MRIIDTPLPEVKILQPELHTDERGFIYESFNQRAFETALGKQVNFVQDNHSLSIQGVLRGLHYQAAPMAQAKLVRVTRGEIFDVAVDIRETSPNYGRWFGTYLSAANRHQLWIPEGFAHGFYVISNEAECLYKLTNYRSPEHERCLAWNHPVFNIHWPIPQAPLLSAKDQAASVTPLQP